MARAMHRLPVPRGLQLTPPPPRRSLHSPPNGPTAAAGRGRYRGVVWDMDGTLTKDGAIDFDAMYRRSGARAAGATNVLAWLETLAGPARRHAAAAIVEVEREGYRRMELNPNCTATLRRCRRLGLRQTLLTRNSDEGVAIFLDRFGLHDVFDGAITRCWAGGRPKPAPDGILHFCQSHGVQPHEVLMVGDWKDDVAAGRGAGCTVVLKAVGPGSQRSNDHLRPLADHVIEDLSDVLAIIQPR